MCEAAILLLLVGETAAEISVLSSLFALFAADLIVYNMCILFINEKSMILKNQSIANVFTLMM